MNESTHDQARRRELRRMRAIAAGLLAAMLSVFVAARWFAGPLAPAWLGYVEAFAEAAMIGAIADWFAVTALFRHPFGLPIPHTAIVPRNKDRLGDSLGRFVAGEFLTAEAIADKLRSVDVSRHAAAWLREPANARMLATRGAAAMPTLIDLMGDEHVRGLVRDGLVRGLRDADIAPLLGRVLSVLVANRRHQALFDRLVELAGDLLHDNHDTIRQKIAEGSRWWMPRFVDEKMFHKIVDGIEDTLMDLRDPAHPWRDQFNAAVADYVARLSSGDPGARIETIKQEILSNPVVLRYLDGVWADVKRRLGDDIGNPDGTIPVAIEHLLLALGDRLSRDDDLRASVDAGVERLALKWLVPHRGEIGHFFTGVVQRWDAGTVADKLELLVGKDLQYIRINGTLVGGTVGVVIHAVAGLAA